MRQPLLLQLLERPALADELTPTQWQQVLADSRQHKLHGTLALKLDARTLPLAADRQMQSARRIVRKQQQDLSYELHQLSHILGDLHPLLLKGGAYFLSQQACARGRLCGDLDLLVDRSQLLEAEKRLVLAGWRPEAHSEHDERYYREWMHEIPPLIHMQRGTMVDLHHAITPPLGTLSVSSPLLRQSQLSLIGSPLRVLSPAAMVIHSALHLVSSGEYDSVWRDFWDIRQLIAAQPDVSKFVGQVLALAEQWAQRDVVTGVLRCVGQFLPQLQLPDLPATTLSWLLQKASAQQPGENWASLLLYSYGHTTRLPPQLLMRHVLRKARPAHSKSGPIS